MGLIRTITALTFMGLFAIAIIGYSVNFANDNNAVVDIGDDSDIATLNSSIREDVITFKESANDSSTIFMESKSRQGDENTEGGGQFKVGSKELYEMTTSITSLIQTKIFGGDTGFGIIITGFLGLLLFILIAYGYKAWFGKDPD
jgi:hypothetical protein